MTDALADWWQHSVSIERYEGSGAKGDVFAAAVDADALVDDTQRLVVDATGQEVISTATVFLPALTADVPLNSRVTLPAQFGGRPARVIVVKRHDAGTLPTPNHVEVNLR